MFLVGRNIAWEYKGADAYLHGNIKLAYALPWAGLGAIVEFAWKPVILRAGEKVIEIEWLSRNVLIVVAVVTAVAAPRMGVKSFFKALRGEKQD